FCLVQHPVQAFHHGWRTCNVIDGRRCALQMPSEHLLIDEPGFTAPGPARFRHFSHTGNQLVLRIVSFQALKLVEERRILRPPIGIEEKNRRSGHMVGYRRSTPGQAMVTRMALSASASTS